MTLRFFNDYLTKVLTLIIFSMFITGCKPAEKAAKIILSNAQDAIASPKITISNFSLGGRKVRLTLRLMNKDDIKNIMNSDFSFFTMGGTDDGVFSQVLDEGDGVFSVIFTGVAEGTKDVYVKIKGKKSETSAPNIVISNQPTPSTSTSSSDSNSQPSSNNTIINTPPKKPLSFACSTTVVASSTGNSCSLVKASPADLDNNSVTYMDAMSTCPSVVVNATTGNVTFSAPTNNSTCLLKVKAFDGLTYSEALASHFITAVSNSSVTTATPSIKTQHPVITIKNTLEYNVSNIANYVLSATDGSLTFNSSTGSGEFTPTKIGTASINLQSSASSAIVKVTVEIVPALTVGLQDIPASIIKRSYHSASVIEEKMYVFGGLDYSQSKNYGDLVAFDPNIGAQGMWSKVSPSSTAAPEARRAHASATILGKMYVFGGYTNEFKNDLWVFDPITNEWTKLNPSGSLPPARGITTASVVGNKMYIIGGANQAGNLSDVWVYTPSVNGSQDYWEQINLIGLKLPARSFHSAAVVLNKIYIFGGSGDGLLNDIWVFDTTQGLWDELHPSTTLPPTGRAHSASVVDGKIFIFGGNGGASIYESRNETWVFDPTTAEGSWSRVTGSATLPLGRIAHSAAVISNKIFIFGGVGFDVNLNDTWTFAPLQGSWSMANASNSASGALSYSISGGVQPISVRVSQGTISNVRGSGIYNPAAGSGPTTLTILDAIGNVMTFNLGNP